MPSISVRRVILACFAILGLLVLTGPGRAFAQSQENSYDIPSEPLGNALRDFGRISGRQVIFTDAIVAGKIAPALHGSFTNDDALARLLAGSDLVADNSVPGGVMVRQKNAQAAQNERAAEKSITESTETILVTAEKLVENIQTTPVPVTVLGADKLLETNQLLLQDYYTRVPSLTLSQGSQSSQDINIRGLSGAGVLLDDVPLQGRIPDIDPGNLAQIEVLRGPQGTLYGVNAMAGLLKFVTVDPSPEEFTARVEAGSNTIYNAGDLGYNFRGLANIPITDDLAVRISGFYRKDAGYIDNPALNLNGINQDIAQGGSLTALWRPADTFSAKLNLLYQDIAGGNGDVTPIDPLTGQKLGDLQQQYTPGATKPFDRSLAAASLVLKWQVDDFKLSTLTGFNVVRAHDFYDFTAQIGSLVTDPVACSGCGFGPQDGAVAIDDRTNSANFSQEFRVEKNLWSVLDIYGGIYYAHTAISLRQGIPVSDLTTGAPAGSFGNVLAPHGNTEAAAYINLTYHVTDAFDIQFGGRYNYLKSISQQIISGDYARLFLNDTSYNAATETSSPPAAFPISHAKAYLIAPRYKVSDDWMVYARMSTGFSPGGVNVPGPGVPLTIGPEQTTNYEIGTKGSFFDGLLSVDASAYHINFADLIQEFINTSGVSYFANVGSAKSEGLELKADVRPSDGLVLSGWVAFDNAEITSKPIGVVSAANIGDQLPNSAHFSTNVSADYRFPISGDMQGVLDASLSYIGKRIGDYGVSPRQSFGAYNKVDLSAGITFDTWTVRLYAANVGNRRGIISGDNEANEPNALFVITPRTFGVSVVKLFNG